MATMAGNAVSLASSLTQKHGNTSAKDDATPALSSADALLICLRRNSGQLSGQRMLAGRVSVRASAGRHGTSVLEKETHVSRSPYTSFLNDKKAVRLTAEDFDVLRWTYSEPDWTTHDDFEFEETKRDEDESQVELLEAVAGGNDSDKAAFPQTFLAAVQAKPPTQKQNNEFGEDYHLNVGYAIRTLREELPTMFFKEMSYNIYREDISFQDPVNTFSGLKNYQLIFWALRFHGKIFFRTLWVDVQRIWQPSDKVLMVRWTVRGIPRVPWEAQGRFDGTSEYRLDKDGKIYFHKVDNVVMDNFRQYHPLTVAEMLKLAGARTPSISCYFKPVGDAAGLQYLASFSWVRFYSALVGTLFLKDKFHCGGC